MPEPHPAAGAPHLELLFMLMGTLGLLQLLGKLEMLVLLGALLMLALLLLCLLRGGHLLGMPLLLFMRRLLQLLPLGMDAGFVMRIAHILLKKRIVSERY